MTDADAIVATWSRDWRAALPRRPEAERDALIAEAREAVEALQEAARKGGVPGHALHRKTLLETSDATFEVLDTVPEAIRLGPFTPGAKWPAVVRLSSAFPVARSDEVPDQRGIGVRISDGEKRLDLLATTGEAHHARDARAMITSLRAAASAVRGGVGGRLGALAILLRELGLRDGVRMARTISRAAEAGVSLAALDYFSRAPFQLGEYAVRYRFAGLGGVERAVRGVGEDALSFDLRERLKEGPVVWSFEVQGYLDPERTPMGDHRVRWRSPWVLGARLTLHGEEGPPPLALAASPSWMAEQDAVFEPLGELNSLRVAPYEASQRGRVGAGGGRTPRRDVAGDGLTRK